MFKVLKSFSCGPNIDVTIVLSSDIYSVVSVRGSALFTCYRSTLLEQILPCLGEVKCGMRSIENYIFALKLFSTH